MKSQRRHELQHNVLDAELARGVDFLRRRRTPLVWGVILVAAALLIVTYAVRSAQAKERSLQATYDRLVTSYTVTGQEFLDGMKSLADCSDKRIAAMATVQVGNYYAAQFSVVGGVIADPRQRDLADQAAAYFRRALADFPNERLSLAEAHVGLARLAEGAGDFAAATQEYQTVTAMTDVAGTPAAAKAAEGLQRLESIKTPVPMATTRAAEPAGKKK